MKRAEPGTKAAASAPESGDPRANRSHAVALAVARTVLVEEGWDALTHGRVAERSGLHRATIYRHFPTTMDLLYEVFAQERDRLRFESTGDLETDLIAALSIMGREFAGDFGRVLCALIDRADRSPEIRDLRAARGKEVLEPIRELLRSAIERGELVPDLDLNLSVAQLVGPIAFRRLISDERITPAFIRGVVDGFLRGYRNP